MNLKIIHSACLHKVYAEITKINFSDKEDKEKVIKTINSMIENNNRDDEEIFDYSE